MTKEALARTNSLNGRGTFNRGPLVSEVRKVPQLPMESYYTEGRVAATVEGPEVFVAGKLLVAEDRKGSLRPVKPEKYEHFCAEMEKAVEVLRATRGGFLEDGVSQLSKLGHRYLTGAISKSDLAVLIKRYVTGQVSQVREPVRRLFTTERETSKVLGKPMKPRNVYFEVPMLSFGFLVDGTPESKMAPVVLRKYSDVEGEPKRLIPIEDYIRTRGAVYLTENRWQEILEAKEEPYYRENSLFQPVNEDHKKSFLFIDYEFARNFLNECLKTIQSKNGQGWISAEAFDALCKIGNLFTSGVIKEKRLLQLGSELCRTGKIRTRKKETERPFLEVNVKETNNFIKVANRLTLGLESSGLFIAVEPATYEEITSSVEKETNGLKNISDFLVSLEDRIRDSKLSPLLANILRNRVAKSLSYALSYFSTNVSGQRNVLPQDELELTYLVAEPDGRLLEKIGKEIGQIDFFNGISLDIATLKKLSEVRVKLASYAFNLPGSIASVLLNDYPEIKRYVETGRKKGNISENEFIDDYTKRKRSKAPAFLAPMVAFSIARARMQEHGLDDELYPTFVGAVQQNIDLFTDGVERELLTGELVKDRYNLIIQDMQNALNYWRKISS